MSIRNTSKAIIIREDKILLNQYQNDKGSLYYELPGGGQLQFETMEEAVIRECKEETGYTVKVLRLAAIAEEIFDDPDLRERFPDYAHRMHHIFITEVSGDTKEEISEADYHQLGSIWIDRQEAQTLPLIPGQLRTELNRIINSEHPVYLGTIHEEGLM